MNGWAYASRTALCIESNARRLPVALASSKDSRTGSSVTPVGFPLPDMDFSTGYLITRTVVAAPAKPWVATL